MLTDGIDDFSDVLRVKYLVDVEALVAQLGEFLPPAMRTVDFTRGQRRRRTA